MKFYISTTGMKRVTVLKADGSGGGGGGGGGGKGVPTSRRISGRAILVAALILGTILPFLFVRIAFLVLESAAACSSPLDCPRWRFFGGSDASLLRDELTRALVEASEEASDDGGGRAGNIGGLPASFKELVKDVMSSKQDLKTFAFKTKAMLLKMEHKVQSARQRETVYWHLASYGVPKSLHCLSLKLAEEYAVNSMARSRIPPPEHVSHLSDPTFCHLVLLTDNVIAASVVVSSTIKNTADPQKLVFHIITDKKTYTPMHAWFATDPVKSAVLEVKGLHQYDWSQEVNIGVKEMLEIHQLNWGHYHNSLNAEGFQVEGEHGKNLEAFRPSYLSLMNHLRIYIPELFPDLNKVVFLDDDIVVQHDLSSLWELDLNGKVNGAVVSSCREEDCCPGRKYKEYFNFSHPVISSNFSGDRCGWLYGMNVLDLQAWRRTNITKTYHQWLKLNLDSGLGLWYPGVLPPALIAFEGHVHPIDPSWHVAGLGHSPRIERDILQDAAVLHFSGPAKPWLEIGFPEVRSLWNKHVNFSNEFVRKCSIMKREGG